MKIFIITVLLVVSYVAASPMWAEEEDSILGRVARAAGKAGKKKHWKSECSNVKELKSGDVKCPKGKKAVIEKDGDDLVSLTCVECDEGQYTGRKGLFESCCACPEGQSTLPGGNTGECFEKCPAGQQSVKSGKRGRKCVACDDDMYSDEEGLECKACPAFHKAKKSDLKKAGKAATSSECKLDKCPEGFIKTPNGDSCRPCGHGNFTNLAEDECKSCDETKPYTLSNANKGAKSCFDLTDEEKECYDYMFDVLKKHGPEMKEKNAGRDGERGSGDDDLGDDDLDHVDPDEGGRPSGDPTGAGGDPDEAGRPSSDQTGAGGDSAGVDGDEGNPPNSGNTDGQLPAGGGGQPPARKRRAAPAGTGGQAGKGNRAKAKEEREKKEKQGRGKSLRSAICKGKGSLDELREKFQKCKELEEASGKRLIPEFAKEKDGKMVGIKDVLEKEDGEPATCSGDDVDEDEEDRCGARSGAGEQDGSGSGSGGRTGRPTESSPKPHTGSTPPPGHGTGTGTGYGTGTGTGTGSGTPPPGPHTGSGTPTGPHAGSGTPPPSPHAGSGSRPPPTGTPPAGSGPGSMPGGVGGDDGQEPPPGGQPGSGGPAKR